LSHRVESVEPGVVRARGRDGTRSWQADAIVLEVPHQDARAITPAPPVERAAGLGAAPIVNVHVIYDRRVTDLPFAAAVNSSVQWFFDRTGTSGLRSGQYLAVTVSAADRATVVDAFVTRERRATFRQAAGTASLRPGPQTGLSGIWLAGSWTATGWPDTMEGAVRSGITAAADVLDVPALEVAA